MSGSASLSKARFMTDDQWVALLGLVNDERQWQYQFPQGPGKSVRGFDPDGKPFVVKADGKVLR